MTPTPQQLAAGVATVAAIIAGAVAGTVYVSHGDPLHARVDFADAPPADTACARIVAVGPSAAWSALGLDTSQPDFAVGYVCSPPDSADPQAQLPAGIRVTETYLVPYTAGMARLELWASRSPDAPRGGCACSQGAGCERLIRTLDGAESWQAAPRGAVMPEGEHRGCTPIVSCYDVSEMPLGSNLAAECRDTPPAESPP